MICKLVSEVRFGNMHHVFNAPLMLVGADEYNVYLVDCSLLIQDLPYVRVFTKEWQFKEEGTNYWFGFEYETY